MQCPFRQLATVSAVQYPVGTPSDPWLAREEGGEGKEKDKRMNKRGKERNRGVGCMYLGQLPKTRWLSHKKSTASLSIVIDASLAVLWVVGSGSGAGRIVNTQT